MDKEDVIESFLTACDHIHECIKQGLSITEIEKLRLETCTLKLRSILLFLERGQA